MIGKHIETANEITVKGYDADISNNGDLVAISDPKTGTYIIRANFVKTSRLWCVNVNGGTLYLSTKDLIKQVELASNHVDNINKVENEKSSQKTGRHCGPIRPDC